MRLFNFLMYLCLLTCFASCTYKCVRSDLHAIHQMDGDCK